MPVFTTMAPKRKRRRRVQKKIDQRFGFLRYDRAAIYSARVSRAIEPLHCLLHARDAMTYGIQNLMVEMVVNPKCAICGKPTTKVAWWERDSPSTSPYPPRDWNYVCEGECSKVFFTQLSIQRAAEVK